MNLKEYKILFESIKNRKLEKSDFLEKEFSKIKIDYEEMIRLDRERACKTAEISRKYVLC